MNVDASPGHRDLGNLLASYRQLVAKVDGHASTVVREHGEELACRPGCSDCCRLQTVFAVEGVALALALQGLPEEELSRLREGEGNHSSEALCPLLRGGLCPLYAARPLICRTHGLPLLVADGDGRRVDYCPHNFRGVATLPGGAVLDLDRLNLLLAAVNRQFLAAWVGQGRPPLPERLRLTAVLRLQL